MEGVDDRGELTGGEGKISGKRGLPYGQFQEKGGAVCAPIREKKIRPSVVRRKKLSRWEETRGERKRKST